MLLDPHERIKELLDALAISTTQLRDLYMGYPPRDLMQPQIDTIRRNRDLLRSLGVDDEGGWDCD